MWLHISDTNNDIFSRSIVIVIEAFDVCTFAILPQYIKIVETEGERKQQQQQKKICKAKHHWNWELGIHTNRKTVLELLCRICTDVKMIAYIVEMRKIIHRLGVDEWNITMVTLANVEFSRDCMPCVAFLLSFWLNFIERYDMLMELNMRKSIKWNNSNNDSNANKLVKRGAWNALKRTNRLKWHHKTSHISTMNNVKCHKFCHFDNILLHVRKNWNWNWNLIVNEVILNSIHFTIRIGKCVKDKYIVKNDQISVSESRDGLV